MTNSILRFIIKFKILSIIILYLTLPLTKQTSTYSLVISCGNYESKYEEMNTKSNKSSVKTLSIEFSGDSHCVLKNEINNFFNRIKLYTSTTYLLLYFKGGELDGLSNFNRL